MSLGADVAWILPSLRAQAASRFTETFTAFTVSSVLDEETGARVPVESVVHSGVPGRLRFNDTQVTEIPQAGQVPVTQGLTISVAVGATPGVAVNTVWRCTASTSDSSLVGRTWRTKGLPTGGQVTAHRYSVESVA